MAASDESLMAAYQRGEVAAFEELVTRHERPLWVFLRRFVGDAATAEDLLQEVFLRVVRAGGDWKADAKFSTWLYTIARNLCTDQSRRAGHRRAISLDSPARPEGGGADGSGPVRDPRGGARGQGSDGVGTGQGGIFAGHGEAAAMNRQLATYIDRAVDALPDDQREVFLMREVMDMPFAEIARAVGVTEPTVKSRMRYALEKLRESLVDFREGTAAVEAGQGAGQRGGQSLSSGEAAKIRGAGGAGKLT